MNRSLYSQELLKSLDNFVREMYKLDLADDPQLVFQLVIKWTKGQSLLTKKLLQYILESRTKIRQGKEAARIETIIRQRLLNEFKHDDLTLPIRKILYVKDLARILVKSKGQIGDREQLYLTKMQQQLGLSVQQSHDVKAQYLKSKLTADNQNSRVEFKSRETTLESNSSNPDAFQDLISLVEKSPIYEELLAQNTTSNHLPSKSFNLGGLLSNKLLWLCLFVPFLLLTVKAIQQINIQRNERVFTDNSMQPDFHCSTKIVSPQMSLGEKLLTSNEQQLPAAKVAFYEASAAFNKCQYTTAQTKFKEALAIERNNPEASIYLNNTKAIARTNPSDSIKIAVSVSLQHQPVVAQEILRGVAQAQLEINKEGGIDSKLLLVQVVNNPQDQNLLEEIAQKLAADKTILATVGYENLAPDYVPDDIKRQQNLAMIYASNAKSKINSKEIDVGPNIFNLVSTLFDYATVNSLNKIAICTDSENTTSSLFAEEFAKRIIRSGGEVTTIPCDLAQENFNPVPVVNRALAQNADAILLSPSANSIERAISVAQVDRDRIALLGNHNFHTTLTTNAGETISQLVLTTPWLPDTAAAQKFANDNRTLWNTEATWRTAMSYNATRAIVRGLEQIQNGRELQFILSDSKLFLDRTNAKPARLAYIGKSPNDSTRYQFLPLDLARPKKPF